jgi:hypothetical protein
MTAPTLLKRKHGHTTMAKKHRGFGGKLEVQSFD